MDSRWALEDLYEFPHTYSQTYSFIYCFDSELDARDADRINYALEGYLWRGGYSYVNIYTILANQVPREHKPEVAKIQYASPGFIDIILNPDVALQVAKSVSILLGTGVAGVEAYKRIYKALLEMNKDKKKQQAEITTYSEAEARALTSMSDTLAKNMGFNNVAELHQRTKNPEVTLKLLMAHHRRLSTLGEFVREGKVSLPVNANEKANK